MNFKRFKYENGLDIIAPLKHGTRWMEEKTNPISIEEIYSIRNIERIEKETYWIYREPKKHLLSALRTEIRTGIEFDGDDKDTIIDKFKTDMGLHWSPTLYESLYQHWNKIEFNLIHLNDLSNLFPGVEYSPSGYDMSDFEKAKHTIEDIIEMVGSTELGKLYEICEKDELWLKRILNNERGLTSYDLLIEKQKMIDLLNKSILDIKKNSKLVEEKLEGEIENLKKTIRKRKINSLI
jgi:hypothetical protein